mmetsp:Transcript_150732/g.281113  ORF Transcript_150732/g.281113 Transcript_150732/m.281113 type:complete len:1012 (-) Transcript_150732:159-3194(-)
MKGIQEALGIDSTNHMKGLQVFIADIRSCSTKEQEQKRVEKELAKIRLKFTSTKAISGYDKKKYVWKLLYAYMLGYDIDFGHFQAVELCSSQKFSEKNAGYLAISLLLSDNADILRLVVNSVKTDMTSHNEHIAALALNTVANIGGAEFADNLFADISKMLLSHSQNYSSYLKRKACISLLRLYRKDNDTLQPEVWRKKLAVLFTDRDIGLLTSISGFALAILEMGAYAIQEWVEMLPSVVQCLHQIVQGDCPDHYEYYHVPAPWLQTKLLRILQFFPNRIFESELLAKVNSILHTILTRPAVQRAPPPPGSNVKKRCKADAERQNRSNAEHGILFESMNLMIHLEDRCDPETTRTASGLLGAFISSTDANIRYLGLETMARLATNVDVFEHLERYKNLIIEKMREPDISIRRQALNLLYALCRPENWQQIVDELLEVLSDSDSLLQEELVLKVAILTEKNAPNFRLYVDVVFRMLESAPDSVGDDVWYRVVQVVTGFEDGQGDQEKANLQRHAADKAFRNLSQQFPHETLVKLGAYLIGEFGHLLPDNISPRTKFEALHRHYQNTQLSSQAKGLLILAIVKLLNANPRELKQAVYAFLEDILDQQDVELQQRACELMQLIKDDELFENVMSVMPVYAEGVQANNPLTQRLKFQHKTRAHTRAQLEEAARSEGGMYKPGVNPARKGPGLGEIADLSGSPQLNNMITDGRPNAGLRNARESESESESDSDEGSEDANNSASVKDMWQNLCIMPQGDFYASSSLCLELKQEYMQSQGRLTIMFRNRSKEPIGNIRVMIPDCPHMRFQQANQAPAGLRPGEQAPHYVQVQCMRPFLQPAKYQVEFTEARGQVVQLPLMLPAVMTKFVSPAEMQMQQFRQYFDGLGGPPREGVLVSTAKVPPAQWPNYLSKGFNLFVLPDSDQSTTLAAGTLNTGTPDPSNPSKPMMVPVMVKLDFEPNRRMTRITARSQHGEVTGPMLKILETYLLVPGQQAPPAAGNAQAGGYPGGSMRSGLL